MNYPNQLSDPRWLDRRREVRERHKNTCQHCGHTDKQLHVHHIAYYGGLMAWEYPDRMLILLCDSCHDNEHANMKASGERLTKALRLAGADNKTLDRISLIIEEICARNVAPSAVLLEIEIALAEAWGRQCR